VSVYTEYQVRRRGEAMRRRLGCLFGVQAIALLSLVGPPASRAQQIQVTSTNPNSAPQGTTSLDVTINGNGFRKGAIAKWFVTGTTNPGGVTVNSTTFNTPTQLTANITVAADATISSFDVQVAAAGRTGKGSDLFAVTQKGTPVGCLTLGTPNGFSLVTELNQVQPNGAASITSLVIGNAIRVRPLDLDHNGTVDTLVAFVMSGGGFVTGSTEGTYVFFLDPATGTLQPNNPITHVPWQNPLLLLSGVRNTLAAAGDVNGDGVPDFVMGGYVGANYLFVGSVNSSTYMPSYTAYQIVLPPGAPSTCCLAVAMGDLDGDGSDEIAVGAVPGKKGANNATVYIFKYANGALTNVQQFQNPTALSGGFGNAIAIGNVDGSTGNELVVGDPGANTNGTVYVFPYPAQQSVSFSLTGPGPSFGQRLGIGDMNGDNVPDLVVITGGSTTPEALVYPGPVHLSEPYANQLLPATGLADSFANPNTDVAEMVAGGAIAIGAPNATTCKTQIGAVHLYATPLAAAQQPSYLFQPPSLVSTSGFAFGFGVGFVPGYPFLLIGDHLQSVGTTGDAGQVYVYKKD
jgi:hypothetical protein